MSRDIDVIYCRNCNFTHWDEAECPVCEAAYKHDLCRLIECELLRVEHGAIGAYAECGAYAKPVEEVCSTCEKLICHFGDDENYEGLD